MRKTTLSLGQTFDAGLGLALIRRVVSNWQARRKLRSLQAFDDYMLADIGLTRDDLRYGLGLPPGSDIIGQMNQIRDERIRTGIRRQ